MTEPNLGQVIAYKEKQHVSRYLSIDMTHVLFFDTF